MGIVISKLVRTKTDSKYLIGYSNKTIRPLVSIMPRMSGLYDKVYTNFRGLNVPENDIECEFFTFLFESFLLIFYLYMKTNITCKYI